MLKKTLYITGAGVSTESGIPTFRGQDGFWTIGSRNYTPQDMATHRMYMTRPDEFLLWYFKRFASYRNVKPNNVHHWLSNKQLITQNIDGLDGKAGNTNYIPIHGRLDKVTVLDKDSLNAPLLDAPWDRVVYQCNDLADDKRLKLLLLDAFKISSSKLVPEPNVSLKPFVLLFDEYYTDLFRMSEAVKWVQNARCLIFIGTSFSVGITDFALRSALSNNSEIKVVDPNPVDLNYTGIKYYQMKASEFISAKLRPQI